MLLIWLSAVAQPDTRATPADCMPSPVPSLGGATQFARVNLQAKPPLMPNRPQLRTDHFLLVAGAVTVPAVLVIKVPVYLHPPKLVVQAPREAQRPRHAAVNGIREFITATGDRAPPEVGRKHARRIRAGVTDSATARQGHAKFTA